MLFPPRWSEDTITRNLADGFSWNAPELAMIRGLSLDSVAEMATVQVVVCVGDASPDSASDPTEAPKSDTVPACGIREAA